MNFTKEQQTVIDSRNSNILVSAAAGAGKTAVLVERVFSLVMDREKAIDIDRLLIVTFTRAAASEMKERLRARLEAEEEKEPDNKRISAQLNLLHVSHIMTIDSFCLEVIRNNFDRIGLDPAFRVADELDMEVLKSDVAEEVMNAAYEEERPEFINLLSCCSPGRNDDGIKEAMLDLFEWAISRPDPEAYLSSLPLRYSADSNLPIENRLWAKAAVYDATNLISELKESLDKAISLCSSPAGPYPYLETLISEREALMELSWLNSWASLKSSLEGFSFGRLPQARDSSIDEGLKEIVKKIRTNCKDQIKGLQERLFFADEKTIQAQLAFSAPLVKELCRLSLAFLKKFSVRKLERGVLDFSDIEHIALKILKGGAGISYREYFQEIMTDEYQDSNEVQEAILTSISRDNNYFCVGDVKQSIYRFRLAEPAIFLRRYASYEDEKRGKRILLSRNFRSRKSILDSANAIFRRIMQPAVGGVAYNDEALLRYGASYGDDRGINKTELLLIKEDDAKDIDRYSIEAREIASKIQSLKAGFTVTDRATGLKRPAEYKDMVILMRSLSGGVDEAFKQVLEEAGIPVYLESRSGYFKTPEVSAILSFLTILNNPLQDIPLIAVLKSPIGGLTDEDLARMRILCPEGKLFLALKKMSLERKGDLENTAKKCAAFLSFYGRFRSKLPYTPIHELISLIIDESGYGLIATAKGANASANLELLVSRAASFEAGDHRGLFRFVRHIEKLKKNELDLGGAGLMDWGNAVRIMSIHKSKGLEFPIVFLPCLNRKLNYSDSRSSLVTDSSLGLGLSFIDPEKRIKYKNIYHGLISRKLHLDALGEELRILYVAMTRPEEKLIMSATVDKDTATLLSSPKGVSQANSYLDLLLYAIQDTATRNSIKIEEKDLPGQVAESVAEELSLKQLKAAWEKTDKNKKYDTALYDRLIKNASWVYPFKASFTVPAKISVSEMKKLSQAAAEEEENALRTKDLFSKQNSSSTKGAIRGTAYHKAFEQLPFGDIESLSDVEEYIMRLVEEEQLTKEAAGLIEPMDILDFAKCGLSGRMAAAAKKGLLYKEQPFLLGVSASSIDASYPGSETILVQGIIDAYFETTKPTE